ncbi:three component ABC system middle component [Burkholderia anthina]|uniref:three component ABC system middle component n=1 Tax=Burkholderia anthina TaxID=179879 RepID=UPI0021BBC031|nr:three component ABC system middle component [Burkholderia anthina]
MHQYRQVPVRMRHGDSDRELARCRYMGRRKLAALRELGEQRGWIKPDTPLPDDAEIAAALGPPHKATSTVSGLEAHRALIASWLEQNLPGTAILAALRREHGYTGSYSSVYRMIVSINADRPPEATVPLSFLVLPVVLHRATAELLRRTRQSSGLRAFATKFGDSQVSKQDLLLQVHERAVRWRELTLQSVELAAAGHLVQLSHDGEVSPLSRTRARGLPDDVKQLMADAEKLGAWCGQLTLHEITTTLKVRL